jgi:2-haloacid dehalogenase
VKALTFDGWGALVDWEAGVRAFVGELLARPKTSEVQRPTVDEWMGRWQRVRRQMLRPYRPWRDVLGRSYDATMQLFSLEAFVDEGPALARRVAQLEPRAGAPSVLRKLAKKYRLALVANPDREALAETLGRLQAPFSSVVTAEDVKAYKPEPRLFALALERLGLPAGEVTHVATSEDEDARPARALGMRTVLVGASGDADLVVPSLEALLDAL